MTKFVSVIAMIPTKDLIDTASTMTVPQLALVAVIVALLVLGLAIWTLGRRT